MSGIPGSPSEVVEGLPWSRVHSLAFATFSMGAALEAYVYALSYVAFTWSPIPRTLAPVLIVWSPLWILIGGLISGFIADRLGRKMSLYVNYSLYLLGALLLAMGGSFALLLPSLSLLLLAAGGEYNSIMVASHEILPRAHRSKSLALELNFANLGGIIVALLASATSRVAVGITAAIAALVLLALRLRLPESVMWLERRRPNAAAAELEKYGSSGRGESRPRRVLRLPPILIRAVIFAAMGWSYTATFSLISLSIGPYFMPSSTDMLILVASSAAFASGFLGLLFDNIGRRISLVASSAAFLALTAALAAAPGAVAGLPFAFWAIFVPLNAALNVFWLLEDILRSETWPVASRGTLTALIRASSLAASMPVMFLAAYLSMNGYLSLALASAAVGLAASLAWWFIGAETGRRSSVLDWDSQ